MKSKIFALCLVCLTSLSAMAETVSNGRVTLLFEESTGQFISFKDETRGQELLNGNGGPLWLIRMKDGTLCKPDEAVQVKTIPVELGLDINWYMADGICVTAWVRLDENSSLVRWRLKVKAPSDSSHAERQLSISEIQFPIISGILPCTDVPEEGGAADENLAVSTWLGSLIHAPRSGVSRERPRVSFSWQSPGSLSMQMMALYGRDGRGMYFASNDTLSYSKNYEIGFESLTTDWRMMHYPALDGSSKYEMPYEAVVGPFCGDWLSAAAIYRDWAQHQRWCRESRFRNGLTPNWVIDTDLWIWNRGRSENVLHEAMDLKQRTGRKVNVFWHWWHGCSYDEGFPEYLPPREGRDSFIKAVRRATKKGIHSLVYMNSFQWGNSTESWEREGAERYAVRNAEGGLLSHAFNVFTGRKLTPMCMATDFWRNRYASLADSVVNRYGVAGVYMDQACMNMRCYAEGHGHNPGGGNYWVYYNY